MAKRSLCLSFCPTLPLSGIPSSSPTQTTLISIQPVGQNLGTSEPGSLSLSPNLTRHLLFHCFGAGFYWITQKDRTQIPNLHSAKTYIYCRLLWWCKVCSLIKTFAPQFHVPVIRLSCSNVEVHMKRRREQEAPCSDL